MQVPGASPRIPPPLCRPNPGGLRKCNDGAAGASAALAGGLQAGLLAQRDSRTPFLAVAFAAAVNLAGDWVLITQYGMGIRGAAWATAGSQVAGSAVLLWTLQTFSVVRSQSPQQVAFGGQALCRPTFAALLLWIA